MDYIELEKEQRGLYRTGEGAKRIIQNRRRSKEYIFELWGNGLERKVLVQLGFFLVKLFFIRLKIYIFNLNIFYFLLYLKIYRKNFKTVQFQNQFYQKLNNNRFRERGLCTIAVSHLHWTILNHNTILTVVFLPHSFISLTFEWIQLKNLIF